MTEVQQQYGSEQTRAPVAFRAVNVDIARQLSSLRGPGAKLLRGSDKAVEDLK